MARRANRKKAASDKATKIRTRDLPVGFSEEDWLQLKGSFTQEGRPIVAQGLAAIFVPRNYKVGREGLIVPRDDNVPVAPTKIRQGLESARDEIHGIVQDIVRTMGVGDFRINEIELTASFSAKGEFLGFGLGGAASIKIKIGPHQVAQ